MPREHDVHEQKYLCSNPNCKSIFYRPKVITYHVCPDCQTLVNINEFADEEEIQIALAAQKLKSRKPQTAEKCEFPVQSQIVVQVAENPLEVEEPPQTEKKMEESNDMDTLEKVVTVERVSLSTQDTTVSDQSQQALVVEASKPSSPQSDCQFGFGYLSQREKGESIPDTCIECAKSLSCMLSDYYKAEKSVKEIKKWYGF